LTSPKAMLPDPDRTGHLPGYPGGAPGQTASVGVGRRRVDGLEQVVLLEARDAERPGDA
jgi:hypothetical protein